jgi:hypothetical protein
MDRRAPRGEELPAPSIDTAAHPIILHGKVTAGGGVGAGPVRMLKREADTLLFAATAK